MIAGRLTYRLTLLEPVATGTMSGARHTDFRATRTVRAERVRQSGRTRTEVGEHFAEVSTMWRIRDAHPVGEGWRVQQLGGYLYSVTAIEPNRERGFLTLTCERVNP